MAVWLVEVDFGAGFVDITAHVERVSKTQRLHKDLRPTSNECHFRVTDKTTAVTFLTTDAQMPLRIRKDGADWFRGIVRHNFQIGVGAGFRGLEVEGVDKYTRLDRKIDASLTWANFDVSKPSNEAQSILHQLFILAGIPSAELSFVAIAKTIPFVVVEREDGATYRELAEQFLFEFGYTVDCGSDGVFRLRDLFPDPLPALTAVADADFHHDLVYEKKETRFEQVRVTWYPNRTLTNQVVFSDTTGGNQLHKANIALGANAWYPTGTDVNDVYSVYKSPVDLAELVIVQNAVLDSLRTNVSVITQTFGSRRALVEFQAGAGGGSIQRFDIRGDAVIRDKADLHRSVRVNVLGTEKIADIQTRWLTAKVDGDRLANGVARWYEHGDVTLRLLARVARAPNDYLELNEAVMGQLLKLRVVEVTEDDEANEWQLLAEAVDTFVVAGVTERNSLVADEPDVRQEKRRDDSGVLVVAASDYTGEARNYQADGAADEAEINAALTEMAARGGGVVQLTEGTYEIAAPIQLQSKVALRGQGRNATLLRRNGAYAVIRANGSQPSPIDDTAVQNMSIQALDSAAVDAIIASWAPRFLLDGVSFRQTGMSCLAIDNSIRVHIRDCKAVDCHTSGNGALVALFYLNFCDFGLVQNVEIFDEVTGERTNLAGALRGIAIQNSDDGVIEQCNFHDVSSRSAAARSLIGFQNTGNRARISDSNVSRVFTYGAAGVVRAIVVGAGAGQIVIGCTFTDLLTYDDQSNINAAIVTSGSDSLIAGNRFERVSEQAINVQAAASRTLLDGNSGSDSGQIIRRAGGESTTPPMVFAETVPFSSNAIWARSAEQVDRGAFSYKFTKNIAASTEARVGVTSNETTTDMHGLGKGVNYTLTARIYLPSGGILGAEVLLRIGDFLVSWQDTEQAAAELFDQWQTVTVTRSLRPDCTGARVQFRAAAAASLNEVFYVDTMRMFPTGDQNAHGNLLTDSGTGTVVA